MNLANYNQGPRILSRPTKVFWDGWESDTYRLQEYGWQFSVEQDIQRRKMYVAMHNQKYPLSGMSDRMDCDYYEHAFNNQARQLEIQMRISNNMRVEHIPMRVDSSFSSFNPVDMVPRYDFSVSSGKLEDLVYFQLLNKDTKEIFLEKASMEDILQIALDKQAPDQARIRKNLVRQQELDKYRRAGKVQAELRLVA